MPYSRVSDVQNRGRAQTDPPPAHPRPKCSSEIDAKACDDRGTISRGGQGLRAGQGAGAADPSRCPPHKLLEIVKEVPRGGRPYAKVGQCLGSDSLWPARSPYKARGVGRGPDFPPSPVV